MLSFWLRSLDLHFWFLDLRLGVNIFCFHWQFPLLYQEGVQNVLFSWRRILGWMLNGFCSAIIIFFSCMKALGLQAFNNDGQTAGRDIVGGTMYTCVVWVVNLQMALAISYFTLVQHVAIWGSIAIWYLFLLIYGAMSPITSTTAYKLLIEDLAPTSSYWLVTFVVVISALIPYFSYSTIQMRFFPMYHQIIQLIRRSSRTNDPEYFDRVRQSLRQSTTFGFTSHLASSTSLLSNENNGHRWYMWICSGIGSSQNGGRISLAELRNFACCVQLKLDIRYLWVLLFLWIEGTTQRSLLQDEGVQEHDSSLSCIW